ncbi:hypothetical protein [Desulfococcus sp.]|uniref:hypothetical protein n=1 Tax=Desulfococcus sp. TaxID=2025834 RepID=UPI00359300D2
MSAITYRAFSRTSKKTAIRFTESRTAECHKGKLLEKSSGGMSFITEHELKPGTGILITMAETTASPNGARPTPDYLGEVRWCLKERKTKTPTYRIGVRLFSRKCVFCGKEIHRSDTDTVDVCEECRDRLCAMSKGKIETCVENYLLGNVI